MTDAQTPERIVPPFSTVTRERLAYVVMYNRDMANRAEKMIEHLDHFPELDEPLAKLFGVQPVTK